MTSRLHRLWNWLVRDRRTGKVVLVQRPNASLAIFLVASGALRLLDPSGALRTGLRVVSVVALLWWSVDEVLRGVNPFRRLLGALVMVVTVAALRTVWIDG
jgi:hypothetical protein